MLEKFTKILQKYCQVMLDENEDYLKFYEIHPGIYSNVDPKTLWDVGAANEDISLTTMRFSH